MAWSLDHVIIISISLLFVFFLINKAPKIVDELAKRHDAFERYGDTIRDFKYRRLVPFVDRIPVSANVLTGSRPMLIWLSMYCFRHHFWLGFTLAPYVLGWLTDYLDGLKARAEHGRKRLLLGSKYKETVFGKYFDPFADMLAFALQTVYCWHSYPPAVIMAFSGALIARTMLFGILLFQRRRSVSLRERLKSDILPKTISGEMKAGIIAISFSLVIIGPDNANALAWASRLLVLAVIVEAVTLTYLVRVAIRMANMKAVEPLQKTGSD